MPQISLVTETETKTRLSQAVGTLLIFLFAAGGVFGIYFFSTRTDNVVYFNTLSVGNAQKMPMGVSGNEVVPAATAEYGPFEDRHAHLVAANIDGDVELETLIADSQGIVSAWNTDGSLVSGWPTDALAGVVTAPAVGNLDTDPEPEIVVAGSYRFFVYEHDGTIKDGWPIDAQNYAQTPVVHDFDGDGVDEIVVAHHIAPGQNEQAVFVYNAGGQVLDPWPLPEPADTVSVKESGQPRGDILSVTLGNIDADQDLEIIAYDAEYRGGQIRGAVWAWNFDGSAVDGDGDGQADWPQRFDRVYQHNLNTGANAVAADLDGDGRDEVIAIGLTDQFNAMNFHVWNGAGEYLEGWPKEMSFQSYSADFLTVGDIAGDARPEIIFPFSTYDDSTEVYAWSADGSVVEGFPATISGGLWMSHLAAVNDIDGDGKGEIIQATRLYQSDDSMISAIDGDGTVLANDFWPLWFDSQDMTTPMIVMLQDGQLWLTAAFAGPDGQGNVNWYNLETKSLQEDWPMFKHDAAHSTRWHSNRTTITP
ncbi:MAG: FG-GAP-like repeat-containing protein [bacterium]|nr:FG-GAP-like repeat-containing protein [bacterium]